MKLACIQFSPVFKEVQQNVDFICNSIENTDADVVVFPELATSGYFFHSTDEAVPFALNAQSSELQNVSNTAMRSKKIAVVGFAEEHEGSLFNSAMVCGFGVEHYVYRKTHLFYREKDVFTPGDTGFNVVRIDHLDCNLGVMICYDWRFPEAARTLALNGADVIASPSNLITHIWQMVMPVRAIENKVYLAIANRMGTETNNGEELTFNGDSTIYGFNGAVLGAADATSQMTISAELDPKATRNKTFNSYNDIFKDRRPNLYFNN